MVDNRIFETAEEKPVKAFVLYASEGKLYKDSDHTAAVSKAELVEMFFVGAYVVSSKTFTMATALTVEDEYAKVTVGSSTYYSNEYSA